MPTTLKTKLSQLAQWMETQGAAPIVLPHRDINGREASAYRWDMGRFGGRLQPIFNRQEITLQDLIGIDEPKKAVVQNTQALLMGKPANNVLLTGARGCGKSSLVRALLPAFYDQGLRIIEMDRSLGDWQVLLMALHRRLQEAKENLAYILFIDDLSFHEGEHGYAAMKSLLDGSLMALPTRVQIYATSNRRHLLPEYAHENLTYQHLDEEIHPGEVIEEKISLSDRFGLWLSFYPIEQELYWSICQHWLALYGVTDWQMARAEALRWALMRGGRNGRIAEQFARDFASRLLPHRD